MKSVSLGPPLDFEITPRHKLKDGIKTDYREYFFFEEMAFWSFFILRLGCVDIIVNLYCRHDIHS